MSSKAPTRRSASERAPASGSLDVVIVSQFFSPEMGAPAARFHDFGRLLVARGHRVTIVTGFPNSPSGVIPPEYRGRLRQRETLDGIEVRRGWIHSSPSLSERAKALGFASFAVSASLWGLFGHLKADVVVATGPPPTVGIPGYLASRRLRAPMIFDVRDIWPEALVASGRLRGGALIRSLEWVERFSYRTAAAITVVTEGKRKRLIERGVSAEKISVLPNGVELSRFDAPEPATAELAGHGVDLERFLLVYAGIFNPAQGLDVLLDAADALRRSAPELAKCLQIVLVGDGSQRERLQERCRQESLGELVAFLPVQPRERIPGLLRAASAIAIPLRPRRDAHTMPSKVYESLASGRPLLVSADGPPADLVRSTGAGIATPPGEPGALADAIRRLMEDPELGRRLGERGAAAAHDFDRRVLVGQFEALLQDVATGRR